MKTLFSLTIITLLSFQGLSQTKIPLTIESGVYTVPCKINGTEVKFIFDTGASTVTISEAFFKQGLSKGIFMDYDILPVVMNFEIANGDIIEGGLINIRNFEIGGLLLRNVTASVIKSQSADMLLGQSAMQRFGSYSIDNIGKLLVLNEGTEIVSNIESDYLKKGKDTGWDEAMTRKIYNQHILSGNQTISFCQNVSFEFYKIILKNKEAGEYSFEYDITNNSSINVGSSGYGRIDIFLEIITTDGTIYSTSQSLVEPFAAGRTIEGPKLSLKTRNKEPRYIQAYCKYYDIVNNKYY